MLTWRRRINSSTARKVQMISCRLACALNKAVKTRGRFQLIDVTIPRGVLSTTLQRFVAGVKRLSAEK